MKLTIVLIPLGEFEMGSFALLTAMVSRYEDHFQALAASAEID